MKNRRRAAGIEVAPVAQWIESRTSNPKAASSSLAGRTNASHCPDGGCGFPPSAALPEKGRSWARFMTLQGSAAYNFRRYVDATRFKGDLFYIQNLATAIEACGQ